MPKTWIQALKQHNAGGDSWCIPRKGTDEWKKVKSIMKGNVRRNPKGKRTLPFNPGETFVQRQVKTHGRFRHQ